MLTKFYDKLLDFLFYLPFGGETRFRKKCASLAYSEQGEKILDICCGTGTLTTMLAKNVTSNGQVIGIDLYKPTIDIAKKKVSYLPLTFLVANAENLPFASSKFDKCYISFGLHHMSRRIRQNALREILRTLKATGSLFALEYNLPNRAMARLAAKVLAKLDKSDQAYKMLVGYNLVQEIEQAGFQLYRRELIGKGILQLIKAQPA